MAQFVMLTTGTSDEPYPVYINAENIAYFHREEEKAHIVFISPHGDGTMGVIVHEAPEDVLAEINPAPS